MASAAAALALAGKTRRLAVLAPRFVSDLGRRGSPTTNHYLAARSTTPLLPPGAPRRLLPLAPAGFLLRFSTGAMKGSLDLDKSMEKKQLGENIFDGTKPCAPEKKKATHANFVDLRDEGAEEEIRNKKTKALHDEAAGTGTEIRDRKQTTGGGGYLHDEGPGEKTRFVKDTTGGDHNKKNHDAVLHLQVPEEKIGSEKKHTTGGDLGRNHVRDEASEEDVLAGKEASVRVGNNGDEASEEEVIAGKKETTGGGGDLNGNHRALRDEGPGEKTRSERKQTTGGDHNEKNHYAVLHEVPEEKIGSEKKQTTGGDLSMNHVRDEASEEEVLADKEASVRVGDEASEEEVIAGKKEASEEEVVAGNEEVLAGKEEASEEELLAGNGGRGDGGNGGRGGGNYCNNSHGCQKKCCCDAASKKDVDSAMDKIAKMMQDDRKQQKAYWAEDKSSKTSQTVIIIFAVFAQICVAAIAGLLWGVAFAVEKAHEKAHQLSSDPKTKQTVVNLMDDMLLYFAYLPGRMGVAAWDKLAIWRRWPKKGKGEKNDEEAKKVKKDNNLFSTATAAWRKYKEMLEKAEAVKKTKEMEKAMRKGEKEAEGKKTA